MSQDPAATHGFRWQDVQSEVDREPTRAAVTIWDGDVTLSAGNGGVTVPTRRLAARPIAICTHRCKTWPKIELGRFLRWK